MYKYFVCRDSRRPEATDESDLDICCEVGNQPTCVYDCYSAAASYQLSVPTHRKYDDAIDITGSDVIDGNATTMTPSCHVTSMHGMNDYSICDCKTNDMNLPASQTLYDPYTSSVTT